MFLQFILWGTETFIHHKDFFVVQPHSNAYFWAFSFCTIGLAHKKYHLYEDLWQRAGISPRKTLKHHLYKSSQTLHHCLLILACADLTHGVYRCETLAPWWPLGHLLSLSISNPVHFVGDGEDKAAVSQLLSEFLRCRSPWEDTMWLEHRSHLSVLHTLPLSLVSLDLHSSPIKWE